MGYCYAHKTNRLLCDCCSKEGARKRVCPCGYCPSAALCSDCYKTVKNDGRWKTAHQNCQKYSDEFHARNKREADLKASGAFVRCSALGSGNLVHVLFENNRGETIGKLMTHDTYDAISLLEPATVEDYAKIGALMDGPSEFDFGNASKTPEEMFV